MIDIDGVLMLGDEVLPGAEAVIETLRAQKTPFLFMTNTTTSCR
ncbi:MAG: TIGR01458 family HAD-type hydrolase, partial [Caldilinea sp.]